MRDDAFERLRGYDGLRYGLGSNWYVRFRIWLVPITDARPYGIRYSFVRHDEVNQRLLGFDNADDVARRVAHDHHLPSDEPVPFNLTISLMLTRYWLTS